MSEDFIGKPEVELNIETIYISPPKKLCDLCGKADACYLMSCKQPEDEKPDRSCVFNDVKYICGICLSIHIAAL